MFHRRNRGNVRNTGRQGRENRNEGGSQLTEDEREDMGEEYKVCMCTEREKERKLRPKLRAIPHQFGSSPKACVLKLLEMLCNLQYYGTSKKERESNSAHMAIAKHCRVAGGEARNGNQQWSQQVAHTANIRCESL